MISNGFSSTVDPDTRVLVLGTLPGQVSLQHQQYYAQPKNAFWKIMGALVGAGLDLTYDARIQRLKDHGIALWDVCASARRPGTLDASIVGHTVVANSFDQLFDAHPGIGMVCFNGAKAEALYRRHVVPNLTSGRNIAYVTLPSTSPANAGMPFAEKLARWSVISMAGVNQIDRGRSPDMQKV
jgi:TDG/mug DNA glycosylase family protein